MPTPVPISATEAAPVRGECARTTSIARACAGRGEHDAAIRADIRRALASAVAQRQQPVLRDRDEAPLFVFRSPIHAFGVFTARRVPAGRTLCEYIGREVGTQIADFLERELRVDTTYLFKCPNGHAVIDATHHGNLARFLNHSCTPNCASGRKALHDRSRVTLAALEDIPAGTELCYDYCMSQGVEGKRDPCFCGTARCNGFMN